MSTLNVVIQGIKNPRRSFVVLYSKLQRDILQHTGVNVMFRDWDNLLILDACRYDLFDKCHSLPGELENIISRGSHTSEFLINNFADETFPDTVYVSATPQIQSHNIEGQFHRSIRLWESHWDEDLRTVPPKAVKNAALEALSQYPNKRLIVHFLQPHYPFIGKKGRNITHRTINGGGILSYAKNEQSIWDRLKNGTLSKQGVWQAYQENFDIVCDCVENLVEELDGKTVVTSDHGNSFGKYGVYGHPAGLYLDCLVSVPWLRIESTTRRKIKSDDTMEIDRQSKIRDRLQDLGYI